MRNLLAVAFIAWMLCFARGWVRRFLWSADADSLSVMLATAGLGMGIMTLLSFWLLVLHVGRPAFLIVLAVSVAVFVSGRLAERHLPARDDDGGAALALPRDVLVLTLGTALAGCCLGILINAAYWPFDIGDALAIYAPFGKDIYTNSRLPVGEGLYESYPMLLPIAYALTHWAAGAVNEYVARLAAALMAIGAIAVAGALGWQLRSRRTGLVAASLVALTPIYGRWASSGYADVPAALYVGSSALFACRWLSGRDTRNLALAGTFAGLALWTKNSVVTIVASLVFVVLLRHWADRGSPWHAWLRDLTIALAPQAVIAGPWYARNWWLFGFVVSNTVWIDRAQRTIASFAVMARPDRHFGVPGWLFSAALLYGSALVFANRSAFVKHWSVLALYVWPFLAAWWWAASYEPRLLMAIIPLLAAMAALMVDDAVVAISQAVSPDTRKRFDLVAAIMVALMALVALRQTVEHKALLIQGLRLDDAAKHRVRIGGLYDLAAALNALPRGSRVTGVPEMTRLHLDEGRFSRLDWTARHSPPDRFADDYDFVAYRHEDRSPYPWETMNPAIIKTSDGYALFATHVATRGSRERTSRPE
jgi:hypothetical protein